MIYGGYHRLNTNKKQNSYNNIMNIYQPSTSNEQLFIYKFWRREEKRIISVYISVKV